MDPYWLLNELDSFASRPQDRFAISEEDKRIYREALFPYWEKRSMKDFINARMTDEVKAAVSTQIFSVNQTDKGQGHIIIDYPDCSIMASRRWLQNSGPQPKARHATTSIRPR